MNKKAFTLIELLVVIAIIAILAAILFPVFAQAKTAAKKTMTISNLKQSSLATMLYMGDNDDGLVPLELLAFTNDPLAATYPSACTGGVCLFGYPLLLQPYSKNVEMFYDPTDRADDATLADSQGRGRFDKNSEYYWYNFGHYASFGMNRRYLNSRVMGPYGPVYSGQPSSIFEAPASTLLYAEATGKDIVSPGRPVVTNPIGNNRVDAPSFWNLGVTFPDARSQGQLWGRYDSKRVVTAWLDGHVSFPAISALKGAGSTTEEIDRFWNGRG